jgi:hypothetical protein
VLITSLELDDSFVTRALLLFGRRPVVPNAIDVTSWTGLLESAQRNFELIALMTERIHPNDSYIGRMIRNGKTYIELNEVSTDAKWDRKRRYRTKNITQMYFGDGYCEALAALVDNEGRYSRALGWALS